MAKKHTRDFGDVIRAKLAADPALAEAVENESFKADIAQQVYELRTEAKLTQKELAEKIGTKQSVISRIEDADYGGHSLNMLRRIARALNRRLKVDFCAQPILRDAGTTEVTQFTPEWASQEAWKIVSGAIKVVPAEPFGTVVSPVSAPTVLPMLFESSGVIVRTKKDDPLVL